MYKNKDVKPVIVIIGGGFCGTALAIQFSRHAGSPLSVVIVNSGQPLNRGVAYGSFNADHLLNVAAGRMSLFPDKSDHFCKWVLSQSEYKQYHSEKLPGMFLPRVIYGKYLCDEFENMKKDLPSFIDMNIIEDEAIDITMSGDNPVVFLKNGSSIQCQKVILATGNFIPGNPGIQNPGFFEQDAKYFRNPWLEEAVKGIENDKELLIIGTGLTMVDNVLSLEKGGYQGKITAVSTKGFFPLAHKITTPYSEILAELKISDPLVNQYHVFKKHIRKVLKSGTTGEIVVDAVRPLTQQIWLSITFKEKNSFMQHIRHLWGVARHRLPAEIHQKVTAMVESGKLEIWSGRLYNMELLKENKIKVEIKKRKSGEIIEKIFDRIINCTGPQSDVSKIENKLFRNLLMKGMICSDPMKLGLNALPDGTILSSNNEPSTYMYTLGSNLKGILWESVAVPELRIQAENLAKMLCHQLAQKPTETLVR